MAALRRAVPLLSLGAASLIWQVGSARSLIAGLYGNELSLGIVLGAWLLLIGLSSAVVGRLRRVEPSSLLALCLGALPLALALSLALQHATLPAFTRVGSLVGPARTLALAALCLAAPCALLGAGFALAARGEERDRAAWAARVYALECGGTFAAGLLFHLALTRLSARGVALAAAAPPMLAALLLLPSLRGRRALAPALAGVALGVLGLAALLGAPLPGTRWLEPAVPGYRLVALESSPHAALAVLRRGDQTLFLANGETVFSDQDRERVEAEVHLTLLAHPAPRRVLMIGGGLGGGLAEALRHAPSSLDYAELAPELVALARRHGGPALVAPLADPRVRVVADDGRRWVAEARERYDAILVGLPGPSSALVNRFYTEEFFALARRALRPGGLLRVSLTGSEGYLSDAEALTHATIRAALARSLGNAAALPGATTLLLAGRERVPDLAPATLHARLAARGLEGEHGPRFFSATELMSRALPFKRELYEQRLAELRPARNSDLWPSAYVQSTLLWVAMSSPALAAVLWRLARLAERWAWVAVPLALALGLGLGRLRWPRRDAGEAGVGAALAVAGGAGLTLELVVVLASQELRGVLFHELAALLASFMIGLAVGAELGPRLARADPASRDRRALRRALFGSALAALLVLAALPLAAASPALALPLFLLALFAVGAGTGACFAPASALFAKRLGGGAPSRAYAWDLAGASVGALLGSALVLPVLGLVFGSAACAALCLGAALSLTGSRRATS
jgi:spermidine synthase